MDNKIDIKENYIFELSSDLLEILLKDRTTKKNIIWATDNYSSRGYGYSFFDPIIISLITSKKGNIIKPRVEKSKKEQTVRVKEKAEVFTPSWVCNAQNNLIDESWFERKNVFNIEKEKTWEVVEEKIIFTEGKSWQDYIKDTRLEITCGEAPYLVSRYDTVSGEIITIKNRIGLLDRKLRIINENTIDEDTWLEWSVIAFKNIYGYDWQGDNVLLARENLLLTFIDYYYERFALTPKLSCLLEIAEIISWNIWQMDGLKFTIPNSCLKEKSPQISIFDDELPDVECIGCKKNLYHNHNGIYCKIKDWKDNKTIKFADLLREKYDE